MPNRSYWSGSNSPVVPKAGNAGLFSSRHNSLYRKALKPKPKAKTKKLSLGVAQYGYRAYICNRKTPKAVADQKNLKGIFAISNFRVKPAAKIKCERSDSEGEYFIFFERAG
ncbi:MAG: hypothetical protein RIC19_04480 [Phaeodactylibacter sp.]|uniref:hypothetical protein n=1 Tax=Phaeodactylibacter sp. TaxID=1940289 RepID=UPI0032EAF47D